MSHLLLVEQVFPFCFTAAATALSVSCSACEGDKHPSNCAAGAGAAMVDFFCSFQLTFMLSLLQYAKYKCKSSRNVSAFNVRRRGDKSVVHRRLFVQEYPDQEMFSSIFKFGDLVRVCRRTGAPLLPTDRTKRVTLHALSG